MHSMGFNEVFFELLFKVGPKRVNVSFSTSASYLIVLTQICPRLVGISDKTFGKLLFIYIFMIKEKDYIFVFCQII